MSPSFTVSCTYKGSPYRCFGPFCPEINGTLSIAFSQTTHRIVRLTVGLKGLVDGRFVNVTAQPLWTQTVGVPVFEPDKKYTTLDEQHLIFNEQQEWYRTIPAVFEKGQTISKDVQFRFPVDKVYLPSSCTDIGDLRAHHGDISVLYKLYVVVEYTKKYSSETASEEFAKLVPFQGQSYTLPINPGASYKEYRVHRVFPAKVKQYYFDEEKQALVPGSLQTAHRHSRKVRSVVEEKYRKKIWEVQQKDVAVTCVFCVKDFIDVLSPLEKLVSIRFEVKADSFEPDFCLNGESTGLGKFDICQFGLYNTYQVDLQVNGHRDTVLRTDPLLLVRFKPGSAQIDVKDFAYDAGSDTYQYLLGPSFFSSVSPNPILSEFNLPCLMYGQSYNFNCRSCLRLRLVLDSANRKEKMKRVYEVDTKTMFYVS